MKEKRIINHQYHERFLSTLLGLWLPFILWVSLAIWLWFGLELWLGCLIYSLLLLVLCLGLGLWLGLASGIGLGMLLIFMPELGLLLVLVLLPSLLLSLWLGLFLSKKFQNQSYTQIPEWMSKFLDEEQSAILFDYRVIWYGKKRSNKWTHFKGNP